MRSLKPDQFVRRQVEPVMEDGCIVNGCIPQDDYAESVFEELQGIAVDFGTLWDSGEMPVLKYDDAFKAWRQRQIDECNALRKEGKT
jgi:hypothetical protein